MPSITLHAVQVRQLDVMDHLDGAVLDAGHGSLTGLLGSLELVRLLRHLLRQSVQQGGIHKVGARGDVHVAVLTTGEIALHQLLDRQVDILAEVDAHVGVEAVGAEGGVVADVAGDIDALAISLALAGSS